MIKFKELLFLKSLKGVRKGKIYSKFWKVLNESEDFYDLASEVELKFNYSPEEIKNAMNEAEELYDYVINSDIHVITVFDKNYPKKLMDMENKKPVILFVKGNVNALNKPNIAVIGTRKPSKLSKLFEENLVKDIVNSTDRVVVSGLALGCDKIAHSVTVDENKVTIAVLPSGVNVITPSSHIKLAEDIISTGGCLVSEYYPNENVQRGNYIERDAIVASFCDATFVVECGINSGTMHTVNFAKDYERPIYTYLPEKRSKDSYDGNEFILSKYDNSIKVEDINQFIEDLETINEDQPKKDKITSLDDFGK